MDTNNFNLKCFQGRLRSLAVRHWYWPYRVIYCSRKQLTCDVQTALKRAAEESSGSAGPQLESRPILTCCQKLSTATQSNLRPEIVLIIPAKTKSKTSRYSSLFRLPRLFIFTVVLINITFVLWDMKE